MNQLLVLCPIRGSLPDRVIAANSGIVTDAPKLGDDPINIHFEGNLYQSESLQYLEQRIYHAASRLRSKYPTVAKGMFCGAEFTVIGKFDERRFHPSVDDSVWCPDLAPIKQQVLNTFPDAHLFIPSLEDFPSVAAHPLKEQIRIPTWGIRATVKGSQKIIGMDFVYCQELAWRDALKCIPASDVS